MKRNLNALLALIVLVSMIMAACGATPTATPVPTATKAPATATPVPVPPTATKAAAAATNTAVPPTATKAAAAPTPVPPTATKAAGPALPAEIVIPLMGPYTGGYPAAGEDFKQGADMAVDEINAKGGIRGSKLKIEYFDDKLDPTEAASLARKIVADKKYPLILGPWSSSSTLAILPIAAEAKMLVWTPAASSAQIAESPWGFKFSTDNQVYGSLMVDLTVKELGLKKLAIMYAQNDFGINQTSPQEALAKKLGGEVVLKEGFTPDTKDFRAILTKVKSSGAQALLLNCYSPEGALILNQAKELGLNVTFIGDGVFLDDAFFNVVGKNAEGIYAVSMPSLMSRWYPELQPQKEKEFYAAFQTRYKQTPQSWETPTYDAVYILASIIDKVGVDRAALRDALEAVKDFDAVSGKVTMGKLHWPLYDMWYFVYKDGKYVTFKDAPEMEYVPKR